MTATRQTARLRLTIKGETMTGQTDLTGKVAWVTGGGSGIGEAAALLLAQAGAKVVLTGRRKALLEQVAASITQKGGTAMVEAGDLMDHATARLPIMRRQQDGVLIHTSSWAGKYVSPVSGTAYTAAKHAVVAMSESINVEEFRNGIRSSVLCPNEIATPILEKRPIKATEAEKARMLQAEDMARLILYIACQPPHVCINEVVISPRWNRFYEKLF